MTDAISHKRAAKTSILMPGVILGSLSAAAMTGPTLFPQNQMLRRAGIIGVALVSAGIGVGIEASVRSLDKHLPSDHLTTELAVGGCGIALASGISLATRGRVTGSRAIIKSTGLVLAAGAGAGAASSLVSQFDDQIPGNNMLAQAGLAAIAGGALLGVSKHNASLAQKATSYLLPDLPVLTADIKSIGKLAVDRGRNVRGVLTTGSGKSTLSWNVMPGQGKRFLTEMPHAVDIERVMQKPAKDPIRTFVALSHDATEKYGTKDSIKRRVELAIDDLEKLGAFGRFKRADDGSTLMLQAPRKSILVPAPTVSGFVNPVAVSTHEFLHLGDTAAVAVQVQAKMIAGIPTGVTTAADTHALLLQQLKDRVSKIPTKYRPSIKVYGESYGAWVSQNAIFNGVDNPTSTLSQLDHFGVDKAMYVGTPGYTKFLPKVTTRTGFLDGSTPPVRIIHDLTEASNIPVNASKNTKITFLQHRLDPVGLVHPRLIWEQPEWLGKPDLRPHGVSPKQRWIPLITGVQTAIDQQGAQLYKKGVFEAKGHDYRSEISYVMRQAFDVQDVSDQQVARIREWNRQLEAIHAAQQKQLAAKRTAAI